jgi:hypothetical protein
MGTMNEPNSPMHSQQPYSPVQNHKKGLGPLAVVGIGCGGLTLLAIIALVVGGIFFGGKAKGYLEEAKKDPTGATARMMVSASFGQIEMVSEDPTNKRYTVKAKGTGDLTTIYWDEKKQAPGMVKGDFSAIPVAGAEPAADTVMPNSAPMPAEK